MFLYGNCFDHLCLHNVIWLIQSRRHFLKSSSQIHRESKNINFIYMHIFATQNMREWSIKDTQTKECNTLEWNSVKDVECK